MKQQITKNAIEASFLKLLGEKPFEKISVRDIVEDCGLTRNAFYYYYDDIYGIVDEVLDREIRRAVALTSSEGASWNDIFVLAANFAEANGKLINHLFRSSKKSELFRYFDSAAETLLGCFAAGISGFEKTDVHDRTLIIDFFKNAVRGMIEQWLDSGMKTSLSDEIRRLSTVFEGCLEKAVENSLRTPR